MNQIPLHEKHTCGCGDHEADWPELDARVIPHAIRHGAIIGAFSQLAPGAAMVLVAPHTPLPLLAQIEQLMPGALQVSYLEEGPQAWRLLFTRTA